METLLKKEADGSSRRQQEAVGAGRGEPIFHFSFLICHLSFSIGPPLSEVTNEKWKMENGKWVFLPLPSAPASFRLPTRSPLCSALELRR